MDKADQVYIYNGMLLSHKKEWNDICHNMDGPKDYHPNEVSQKEKTDTI